MKVDYCLILAAGHGTRMGELGKTLPKPLWPVFDRVMLGLQVDYAQSFNPKKIFVNAHHQAEQIKTFIKDNYPDVIVLHEKELLGSGGGIHNLAAQTSVNYQGHLLIINSDQFYFYEKEFNQKFFSNDSYDVRLVGLNVNKGEKYNGLIINDGLLSQINPPESFQEDYLTYSGVALVNLSRLNKISGNTSFFETVANYKDLKVEVLTPKQSEYWDFGTKDLYKKNIKQLISERAGSRESLFINFCNSNAVFSNKNDLMEVDKNNRIFLKINQVLFEVD